MAHAGFRAPHFLFLWFEDLLQPPFYRKCDENHLLVHFVARGRCTDLGKIAQFESPMEVWLGEITLAFSCSPSGLRSGTFPGRDRVSFAEPVHNCLVR